MYLAKGHPALILHLAELQCRGTAHLQLSMFGIQEADVQGRVRGDLKAFASCPLLRHGFPSVLHRRRLTPVKYRSNRTVRDEQHVVCCGRQTGLRIWGGWKAGLPGELTWHRHLDRSTLLNLQGNVLLGPSSRVQVLQQ